MPEGATAMNENKARWEDRWRCAILNRVAGKASEMQQGSKLERFQRQWGWQCGCQCDWSEFQAWPRCEEVEGQREEACHKGSWKWRHLHLLPSVWTLSLQSTLTVLAKSSFPLFIKFSQDSWTPLSPSPGILFLLLLWHFQHFCGTVSFPFYMPLAPSSELLEGRNPKSYSGDAKGRELLTDAPPPCGCPLCHTGQVFPT